MALNKYEDGELACKEQLLDRMMLRISLTPTLSRLRPREQS